MITSNGFGTNIKEDDKSLEVADNQPLSPGFVTNNEQFHQTVSTHNVAAADLDSENSNSSDNGSCIGNKSNNNTSVYRERLTDVKPMKKANFTKSVAGSKNNLATDKSRDRYIQRQYDHVIRMLITVTLVFSVCQIPDMVQQLISRLGNWSLADEFGIIAYDFIIINSSINLFIYTATSQRFKQKLMKTFKCCKRKDKVAPLPGPTSLEQT